MENISALTSELLKCNGEITLKAANALIAAVMEYAQNKGVKVVCAVADASARPISVQSADGAYIASYDIALNKSYTSVALKMPTSDLKTLAAPGGSLYGIQWTNGGKIVIFGGGVPLKRNDGKIVGALGVSGGTEEEDTAFALFGQRLFEEIQHQMKG